MARRKKRKARVYKDTSNMGGPRPGAGRPPLMGGRKIQKTVNLPPALHAAIEASAETTGRSVPMEIVEWCQDALTRKAKVAAFKEGLKT